MKKRSQSRFQRLSPEAFTRRAIKQLRGKYPGLHTVYSGFNNAFRAAYPKMDPVAFTQALAAKGRIGLRLVKGGAMLFLPGEMRERSAHVLETIRGAGQRGRPNDASLRGRAPGVDKPQEEDDSYLADDHQIHTIARDSDVTTSFVLRRARTLGIRALTEFAVLSSEDEARLRRSIDRPARAAALAAPRRSKKQIGLVAPRPKKKSNSRPVKSKERSTVRKRRVSARAKARSEVVALQRVSPATHTSTDITVADAPLPHIGLKNASSLAVAVAATQPLAASLSAAPAPQGEAHLEEWADLQSRLDAKERDIIRLKDLVDTYEKYLAKFESDHKTEVSDLVSQLTARDEELAARKETIQRLERIAGEKRADVVTYLRHLLPRLQFDRDSLKTVQQLPRVSETLLRTLQAIHVGHHPEGAEKISGVKRSKTFKCRFSDGQSDRGRLYYCLDESAEGSHRVLIAAAADDKQKKENIEWIRTHW